jgi:DNA polymerase V
MTLGGKRIGAGRPKGTGKYGEVTKTVRLPESKIVDIQTWLQEQKRAGLSESIEAIYGCDVSTKLELPLYLCAAAAGFPSPADDHLDSKLDLNALVVHSPASTYFLRASGNSMNGASINDGDLMVVDRSLEAVHDDIVIAVVNGEITVKRLHWIDEEVLLIPENSNYKTIAINENTEFHIWGVVTDVLHSFYRKSRLKVRSRRLQ